MCYIALTFSGALGGCLNLGLNYDVDTVHLCAVKIHKVREPH